MKAPSISIAKAQAHSLKLKLKLLIFRHQIIIYFMKKETASPKKAKVIFIFYLTKRLSCHTTAILLESKQNNAVF